MNKLIQLSFITFLYCITNLSISSETLKENFINEFCDQVNGDKNCSCQAIQRYELLSDEQKGFMQLGIEIKQTNPELSVNEINDIVKTTYDPDGRIESEIRANMQKLEKGSSNICSPVTE